MRWDLDGDGNATDLTNYIAAFPSHAPRMGCVLSTCTGYELRANLDFDTDGDGTADSGDDYWNSGNGWDPIGGTSGGAYTANFDGNNDTDATVDGGPYTISNLFIKRKDGNYIGLFANIDAGGNSREVKNVALVNVDIAVDQAGLNDTMTVDTHIGALAGKVEDTIVTGSYSTGKVKGAVNVDTTDKHLYIGGLVGQATDTDIVSSYSWADVEADTTGSTHRANAYAGGLAGLIGKVNGSASTRVTASYAAGDVTGKARTDSIGGASYAGGLVGMVSNGSDVEASYARGDVEGSATQGNNNRGALAGYIQGTNSKPSEIKASYATGEVSGTVNPTSRCGLVGNKSASYATITDSYYNSEATGQSGLRLQQRHGLDRQQLANPR